MRPRSGPRVVEGVATGVNPVASVAESLHCGKRAMRPRQGSVGIAMLLGIAAAVSGCYESSLPLSPPGKVAADAALFGRWHCVPDPEKKEDNDQAILAIVPFDAAQYLAEWTEDGKVTRY